MNALENQLHYPQGDALPPPGRSLEVAPGVRWLRMGLPFALDHINLWLLRDAVDGRPGWCVVDCGITSADTQALWEQVFAHELQGLPILRVVVTHMHPDHVGLAHWLCARWQAPLAMSATDYHAARLGSLAAGGFGGETAARFFASHGLRDEGALAAIRGRTNHYPSLVPAVPDRYQRLMDGDVLRIGDNDWRCISGYGHAPEHIALACPGLAWHPGQRTAPDLDPDRPDLGAPRRGQGVLIGGDMLLPRISTNVSTYDTEPESNPLPLFLDSIDKFAALPPATLTLPSHGKPFTGLHTRIAQLHAHHRDRLAEVRDACAVRPHSGHDILPLMFKRPLDLHQTTFALGEAVAHLHALWHDGQLQRRLDDDGVYRFRLA